MVDVIYFGRGHWGPLCILLGKESNVQIMF